MTQKKIPLVEMFGPTIQGEGAVIGQQTFFLRFGLCDYRCRMCDSMHAVDPIQVKAKAQWLTQDEIYIQLKEFRRAIAPNSKRCVTFSGGNPCIHDLTILCEELKMHGWDIVVETQGTLMPAWLRYADTLTISPKGPGMGENTDLKQLDEFVLTANNILLFDDEVGNFKIVVFDQRDLEFAKMLYERYRAYTDQWYLSLGNPYPPGMDDNVGADLKPNLLQAYRQLWDDIKNDAILSNFRFLPQWHVFVWGNEKGK